MPKSVKDVNLTADKAAAETKDQATVRWVEALFVKAKQAASARHGRIRTNRKWYEGGKGHWEWKGAMPTYRSQIVDNRCFSNVESALPIITDAKPKVEIVADVQEDVEKVKPLSYTVDAKWEDLDLELKTTRVVKGALIDGEGWWKVYWDTEKLAGTGDVGVTVVDPLHMYPDPDARDPLLKDAYYVFYHGPTSLSALRARYPEKAKELNQLYTRRAASTTGDGTEGSSLRGEQVHDETWNPDTQEWEDDTAVSGTWWGRGTPLDGSERLMVTELWIDDKSVTQVSKDYLVDVSGENNPEEWTEEAEQVWVAAGIDYEIIAPEDLPKFDYEDGRRWVRDFPHGRIITTCGKVLLRDRPSPYTHGRCPYVRFWRYEVPGKNYFFGELDQIIPLQKELNERKSQIVDLLTLTQNPPIVVHQGSGIDTSKLTNRPGGIWPVSMDVDRAIKWLQVPNLPSALFVQIEQINRDLDTVSGIHDITQGRKPTGITAGIAIESLQEAAQIRMRLAARFLEYSHKHSAELMLSIIWQFYREPRTVKKKKPDGEWEYKDINFHNVEVKIQTGSTMHRNQAVLQQQSLELYKVQAIDREALLEVFDFPNRQAVIERMKVIDQQMAEMQMQQNMQKTGGVQ